MKKLFYSAAIAALALTACAKVETIDNTSGTPVGFSAYTGKSVTKAGATGELTTTGLQTTGFGVFAYQTTGNYVASGEGAIEPNFMYNQKVTYSASTWGYTPVKYWPNQIKNGNTDAQSTPATATQADKVSFFAYAPYVKVGVDSGDNTTHGKPVDELGALITPNPSGILEVTKNNVTGDPKITYAVTDDLDNQVDLVWGVAYANSTNPTETWNTVDAETTVTLYPGKPFLNLQKPAIGTDIHFYFRHALAQINLQAVAAYNQVAAGGEAKNNVKITINQVTLSVPNMKNKAILNLNNTEKNTPLWGAAEGTTNNNTLTLTVANANINPVLVYQGTQVQTNTGVVVPAVLPSTDPYVIKDGKYFTVLPNNGTSTTIQVTVDYYVTTPDNSLASGYSQVRNTISHPVTFSSGLAGGYKYTIKMILGISEVKMSGEVSEWEVGSTQSVDLPQNQAGA